MKTPYCNCRGAFEYSGKKVTKNVQYGHGVSVPTIVSSDGQTCEFCEHFVQWRLSDSSLVEIKRPFLDEELPLHIPNFRLIDSVL